MLLSFVVCLFYLSAFISIIYSGNLSVSDTIINGSERAAEFCLGMAGSICLWCAVMEVFEQCGLVSALSRRLKPLIVRLLPVSSGDEEICSALSENISANIMGLGNAATPAGIRAAKKIAALGDSHKIADELCLLVVLNTASLQIIPTTTATLRAASGAAAPFDILPAVWVSTLCSMAVGLASAFFFKRLWH